MPGQKVSGRGNFSGKFPERETLKPSENRGKYLKVSTSVYGNFPPDLMETF